MGLYIISFETNAVGSEQDGSKTAQQTTFFKIWILKFLLITNNLTSGHYLETDKYLYF